MMEEARKAGLHRLLLADEAATLRLAADIAAILKPGDIVEIEIERIGILRNSIVDER